MEMGAYLCIATNGIPPTVSKRIIVDVECKLIKILKIITIIFNYTDKIFHVILFYFIYINIFFFFFLA